MAAETRRVAIAQAGTCLFDREATFAKLERFARQAAESGAELVVFPEAFIGGYPKFLDFGVRLGVRSDEGRAWFQRYAEEAVVIGGDAESRIATIAAGCGIALLVGAIERDGGTLYCASLLYDGSGARLNHHRKLVPTALERVIWGQGDGRGLRVAETPAGRVGALICWENYMPLARMALYRQDMQIHGMLTVDDREAWLPTARHVAREGRCFVLSSCQFLPWTAYPGDLAEDLRRGGLEPPPVAIAGGSCVISPMGEVLAMAPRDREHLLVQDIDLADILRGRFDFDAAGHYHRPDVFGFEIRGTDE